MVFWGLLLVATALLSFQLISSYIYPKTTSLYIGDGAFSARVANSEAARTKGLSGTESLPSDEVMLFVFESDSKWGIWMKDMQYSIDVVWLDESKKVVDMALGVTPSSYPRIFTPKKDARYVLEFAAGTVRQQSIREGQHAVFSDIRSEQ